MISILAISGSLRAASSNTTILRAAATLAPPGVSVTLYSGLADLPHFNPDLERSSPPAVIDLRRRLAEAHAVLICSPEYAHGIPGSLKNALDWLVGTGDLSGRPVALLNASPVSHHAQDSLIEVITVMEGIIVPSATRRVPLNSNRVVLAEMLATEPITEAIRTSIAELARAVQC